MRERGLKPQIYADFILYFGSLPVRERGLKPQYIEFDKCGRAVAPRAGAWIETLTLAKIEGYDKVAPRAGAWIETVV